MTATEILNKLENRQVLIVGDVMVDRYLMGKVSRISPEAPVPVVLYERTDDRLGGAANVALNIQALGSTPLLCSVIGDDPVGTSFRDLLTKRKMDPGGLVSSTTRQTTVKTRVLGNNHQMLRIDQEDAHDLSTEEASRLSSKVLDILDRHPVDVVIFQDYNKGILTPEVIAEVTAGARKRGIQTAVDPKKENFFAFHQVDLFKPNLKEIRDSAPFQVDTTLESLRKAAAFLHETIQNRMTMITLSEKGLFLDDGVSGALYPTETRNVSDVSGAGDTVISIAALAMAAGMDNQTIATLSNLAGGQVCEYPGVVPVQRSILEVELSRWLNT
ncbi:MAG: carbohydrate kinase [Bacteroidetes bacterium]|nr:MAG: carbohydrate kinase [Bacteroidota bacterium]